LHAKAKAEACYRFYALYNKISREDILSHGPLLHCNIFGIVDPHQDRSGVDILPSLDWHVGDAPINAGCDIEPRRVDLALHQQRFGPHQVPD
jgi:hypothetical protein